MPKAKSYWGDKMIRVLLNNIKACIESETERRDRFSWGGASYLKIKKSALKQDHDGQVSSTLKILVGLGYLKPPEEISGDEIHYGFNLRQDAPDLDEEGALRKLKTFFGMIKDHRKPVVTIEKDASKR